MELETKKLTASEILKLKIQNGEISSFFDCLTDILLKYSNEKILENQDFKKYFNSYMICRYISMKESLITYAENLNIVQNILTPEQFYKLAYKLIPKQRSGYIKYIKKNKKENESENREEINSSNVDSLLFEL